MASSDTYTPPPPPYGGTTLTELVKVARTVGHQVVAVPAAVAESARPSHVVHAYSGHGLQMR